MAMKPTLHGAPSSVPSSIDVDLKQVIYALSEALDIVGVDDVAHGKRVGLMAVSCAQTLGLDRAETDYLFDLGMLHDIGVSSTATHNHLIREFDWEGSPEHCERGRTWLSTFAPLAELAEPVRYHHTHWDVLAGLPDISRKTAEFANLIYLVDRVDALAAPFFASGAYLMHIASIRQKIGELAGHYFAPELVDAFLAASASEAFWMQLEPRAIQSRMSMMLSSEKTCRAEMNDLMELAALFARIVDAKSPFTADHSLGVSRLARLLGERLGVSPENRDKLQIAGLLHDLGKLRIPDEILEKPMKLDERERRIINTHSFETFRILHHIKGFDEIARWAAYHHEKPDGSGYPFHLHGDMLPFEARIVRVADVFQSLLQDRPYRAALPIQSAIGFLRNMAAAGSVDQSIVEAAAEHPAETLELACCAV
jgi:putative nucleotidyltransferase with HDIG domain